MSNDTHLKTFKSIFKTPYHFIKMVPFYSSFFLFMCFDRGSGDQERVPFTW